MRFLALEFPLRSQQVFDSKSLIEKDPRKCLKTKVRARKCEKEKGLLFLFQSLSKAVKHAISIQNWLISTWKPSDFSLWNLLYVFNKCLIPRHLQKRSS
jgi:hypothetical protein